MTEKARYADRLLEEFESICEENNIEYKFAWGPENYGTGVIMTPSNCSKFMGVVASNPQDNRVIESWANSPNYPTPTVRYIGTDSLCYNIFDYPTYKYHGIFVEINILRETSSSIIDKRYYNIAERGIYLNTYNFNTQKNNKNDKKLLKRYDFICKLTGGEEALKKKTLMHILKSQDISLDSKAADKFKPRMYSVMYVSYTIVDENINSLEYFRDNSDTIDKLSQDGLNEARKCKVRIDKARRDINSSMSTAKKAWEIICRVDDEIKGIDSDEIEE